MSTLRPEHECGFVEERVCRSQGPTGQMSSRKVLCCGALHGVQSGSDVGSRDERRSEGSAGLDAAGLRGKVSRPPLAAMGGHGRYSAGEGPD